MKKSSLSLEDFENLLFQAERLCGYAMGKMSLSYRANQAMCARETLGVVFLVIDTLYCAAKILGDRSMKELWWPRIMRRIEGVKYIPSAVVPSLTKCIRNLDVARTLSAALEYYRRGERPPPRMVIGLKEALFCEKCPSSKFNQEKWDLWREDVRSWRRHIQLMLAESK
ncbi:uncharacterized protein EMH_0089260 [Eimeria mitis]|uniref:Uncharacterized protein n=1 Tax=Eimeria mitis TaxID=44415 RepID=U6KM42_9EIME|nr:uncharacterized protein EMH_0089260 [Eimeria mitis]CDJ36528.1 hypothetical protein EMH_0089260 [Eimeria mitis]